MKSLSLTQTQLIRVITMGVILWFAAAMLLRWLGPMGVHEGMWRVLMYALIIPGTLPFVFLVKRIAGLQDHQVALGYAAATTAAMLCDGLALAWMPDLYGGSAELVAGAGAVILWGAGVGIVLAFLVNKPAD